MSLSATEEFLCLNTLYEVKEKDFITIVSNSRDLTILYIKFLLEANQTKNNCLMSNFYNKLKFPALFSVRNRWEKSA